MIVYHLYKQPDFEGDFSFITMENFTEHLNKVAVESGVLGPASPSEIIVHDRMATLIYRDLDFSTLFQNFQNIYNSLFRNNKVDKVLILGIRCTNIGAFVEFMGKMSALEREEKSHG